jgi:extracellular factor (EF) 3-hydroxypalmitic acid methyl ester biosynthesis protein
MFLHYEQLEGAFGHKAFYRPRRYLTSELLSSAANPRLQIQGRNYDLVNLSTNGACLLAARDGADWGLAQTIDVRLMVHGVEVQRSAATIVRIEPGPNTLRVALTLNRGYFDLPSLRRIDAEANLRRHLTRGPEDHSGLLPREFRDAVARLVHFVQFYKRSLETLGCVSAVDERSMTELAASIYPSVFEKYTPLREAAALSSLALYEDAALLRAAKQYTETMLTPLLLSAPIVRRAYTKPLGYPGDYLVMQQCYDNGFEGDTVFAKVLHKVFVQHPMSASLISRKNHVVACMQHEHSLVLDRDPEAEFRVTSLGCGPAREVSEYIEARKHWTGSARWRLFDQEERTLELAHESVFRGIAVNGSNGIVECLNLSFGQLLKNRALLEQGGHQHFIYSTGLFDYLARRTAQALIESLYACLAPGGLLLIGNAAGPNRHFFCPEFILDWTLIYRSREEMYELASPLAHVANVHVEHEAGGAYWFISVRKPA